MVLSSDLSPIVFYGTELKKVNLDKNINKKHAGAVGSTLFTLLPHINGLVCDFCISNALALIQYRLDGMLWMGLCFSLQKRELTSSNFKATRSIV